MSKNYFIGDCHFSHNKISERFRKQFDSDYEHDVVIFNNIMECGGKRNHLWLLGDIFLKPEALSKLDSFADVFGTVNICLGNHDCVETSKYAAQFDNVNVFGIIKKFGMWISHAPIHPCELYRGVSLHGHCHSKSVTFTDKFEEEKLDPHYLCVSCEQVDYKPVTLDHIRNHFMRVGSLLK